MSEALENAAEQFIAWREDGVPEHPMLDYFAEIFASALFASLPDSAVEAGPAAWLCTRQSTVWAAMPDSMTEIVREVFEAEGVKIEPLYTHPAPHPVGSALTEAAFEEVMRRAAVPEMYRKDMRNGFQSLALAAAPAPADPYATYGKRGECDKPALKGRAAIVDAWNDLPEEIRQCPDLAKLWAALGECDDAAPAPACKTCETLAAEVKTWRRVHEAEDEGYASLLRMYEAREAEAHALSEEIIKLRRAAAPAPAVKGYHPAVSGEAFGLVCVTDDRGGFSGELTDYGREVMAKGAKVRVYFHGFRDAAPSHPPATPAVAEGLSGQLAKAVEASEAGHDPFCMSILRGKECSCGLEPAVAVQAEPSELLRQRANEIASMAKPDYFNKVRAAVLALAAHPKPAAPATADDAVSDEATVLALMRKFQELPSWDRSYAAALETDVRSILGLRSGASAQPAGGA